MNAFERVVTVLQGGIPDCVPVFPVLLQQGAAELNVSLPEYFRYGENWAHGQLRLWQRYGHDCVFGIPHVVEDVTAFGASLMYFENGAPSVGRMVINRYEAWFDLAIPDPVETPELQETLRAIEWLKSQLGGEVPVAGACIAPFSLPSMLMGTEHWMRLLFLEPPELRAEVLPQILDITTEFCVRWANLQLEAGADAIVLADGMASAAVITRNQFIDLALPSVRNTLAQINGPVIHEGVGDIYPMLDLIAETGAVGVILTYQDDLAAAKSEVGHNLVLLGNLNNIDIRNWTPHQMRQKAQIALEQGAANGRFILSAQGPEIPLGTAPEVIQAMIDTGHNWRY